MSDLFPAAAKEYRFTIADLVMGMQRELDYRERVYARLVQERKKTQAEADKGKALVRAVIETLQTFPADKIVRVAA